MKIKPFDFILLVLIAIIIALSFWIYNLYQNNDNSILEELEKSKGRVEILQRQFNQEKLKTDSLYILRREIKELSEAEPKRRVLIIKNYNDKIKNIDNQSVDSTLQSITNRLSNVR